MFIYYLIRIFFYILYSFRTLTKFSKSDLIKIEKARKRSSIKVQEIDNNNSKNKNDDISEVDVDERNITAIIPENKSKYNSDGGDGGIAFIEAKDEIKYDIQENEILNNIWAETKHKIHAKQHVADMKFAEN